MKIRYSHLVNSDFILVRFSHFWIISTNSKINFFYDFGNYAILEHVQQDGPIWAFILEGIHVNLC